MLSSVRIGRGRRRDVRWPAAAAGEGRGEEREVDEDVRKIEESVGLKFGGFLSLIREGRVKDTTRHGEAGEAR